MRKTRKHGLHNLPLVDAAAVRERAMATRPSEEGESIREFEDHTDI